MAVKTLEQLEKNISLSFSYVKKDLISLNEKIEKLDEKIRHLSLNQAEILSKLLKEKKSKKEKR